MAREFLSKRLPGCVLKNYLECNAERTKQGLPLLSREQCAPSYCEYASESERPADPVCEINRRRIADLEACPLSSTTPRAAAQDSAEAPAEGGDLLSGISWTKINNA